MVINVSDFLNAVEDNSFINNQDLQNQMMTLALNSMDSSLLMIICHLIELHPNTFFATNVITKALKHQSTVDQVLEALTYLSTIPVAEFAEVVFAKGTTEQINRFSKIRQGWTSTKATHES